MGAWSVGVEGGRGPLSRLGHPDSAQHRLACLIPVSLCPTPARALQPVRDHFESNAEAKALLKQVKSFKVTK